MTLNVIINLDESWDSYRNRPLSELLDKLFGPLNEMDGVRADLTNIRG